MFQNTTVRHKYYRFVKQCRNLVAQKNFTSRNISKILYQRFLFWPSNLGVAQPPPNSFICPLRPTLAKSGGGPASRTPCGSSGSSETPQKPTCLGPPTLANSPCAKKPSQFPVKPKRRMTFKNDRFFNFMFSKHVLMHQYGIIPVLIICFGSALTIHLFTILRIIFTRPEIKWTTRSKFGYETYDLEKPLNHKSKFFTYYQQYEPNPDLKRLFREMKEAKQEYEEEERKKKEAEALEAANVVQITEVAQREAAEEVAMKAAEEEEVDMEATREKRINFF